MFVAEKVLLLLVISLTDENNIESRSPQTTVIVPIVLAVSRGVKTVDGSIEPLFW